MRFKVGDILENKGEYKRVFKIVGDEVFYECLKGDRFYCFAKKESFLKSEKIIPSMPHIEEEIEEPKAIYMNRIAFEELKKSTRTDSARISCDKSDFADPVVLSTFINLKKKTKKFDWESGKWK